MIGSGNVSWLAVYVVPSPSLILKMYVINVIIISCSNSGVSNKDSHSLSGTKDFDLRRNNGVCIRIPRILGMDFTSSLV